MVVVTDNEYGRIKGLTHLEEWWLVKRSCGVLRNGNRVVHFTMGYKQIKISPFHSLKGSAIIE